jgi:hypothetical protein
MRLAAPPSPPLAQRWFLGLFAFAATAAAVYLTRQADPDLWGHLRYGRFFVEQRHLPDADPFAYTSAGQRWSSHEYLAQVLLWLAYDVGGQSGLVVLKCLLGGAAVWCLWGAIRVAAPDLRVAVPVILITSHLLSRWFLFRPQLFTFFLFAVFVRILLAHLAGRQARLWLLPLLMIPWVNLHGGFLAGIGAVGLALGLRALQAGTWQLRPLGRALLPLVMTAAGCLLATLLNPLGWRLWPYLATELSCDFNRRFIEEWQPLSLAEHGWMAWTFWAFLVLLVLATVAAGRPPVSGLPGWIWLASCLPLVVLASRSIRHIPICALWAGPVLALLTGSAFAVRRSSLWRGVWMGVAVLAAIPAVLTIRFVLADPAPAVNLGGPVLGACSPRGAVAFLHANRLAGRVYNPLWWGSYLTWELHPDILVSMDGRNVTLFPAALVAENLGFYLDAAADPATPLASEPDFLLVPADTPVLLQLRQDGRWVLLFDDGEALLFVRADAAHAPILRLRDAGELQVPPGGALALGPS